MTPMTVFSGLAAALVALSPAAAFVEVTTVAKVAEVAEVTAHSETAARSPAAAFPEAASPVVGAPAAQPESPIDINTASAEELTQLPRVGPATAKKIVAWREENGPFTSTKELLNVDGIGERTYELIEPHVTVGGSGDSAGSAASAASAAAGAPPVASAALAD